MDDNALHQEPHKDGFKNESPIRAFTTWQAQGRYALGKGFRPSLAHTIPYLDAMREKEGYRLVQVLEAGTGTPSFLFEREREISVDVLLDRLACGNDEAFRQRVKEWLATGEEPFINETRRAGFAEAGEKIDRAREMSDALDAVPEGMDRKFAFDGLDPEATYHTRANWTAKIDMLYTALVSMKGQHRANFLKREKADDPKHYWDTASVASVLRLIDKLEWWDRIWLADYIGPQRLSRLLGRKFRDDDPALKASAASWQRLCAATSTSSLGEAYMHGQDPVEVLRDIAEDIGQATGREVDHAAFDRAAEVISELVPGEDAVIAHGERVFDDFVRDNAEEIVATMTGDDPINPKHYGGRECADIGELLTANSYQILKYNWRLGEKDSPCQELGKALWYLDSELALTPQAVLVPRTLPEHTWFDEKLRGASDHAKAVARVLISWNRYGNRHSLTGLRKLLQSKLDSLNGCNEWGRGLEP